MGSRTDLLLRAARGENVERTPVWMMRQAGRYLEEYRAIRKDNGFLDICRNPELAAEVSLQPLDAVGTDGCILFADILTPFEALGIGFDLDHGGPKIHHPIRTQADVAKLEKRDPREAVPYVYEALRLLRKELEGKVPLIGFCGAPFTLAAYLVEGGGSKDYGQIKGMAFREPNVLHALLEILTDTMIDYLNAQVEAGAQIVQVFDTWAGQLTLEDYELFARPYEQQLVQSVKNSGVPVTIYIRGATAWLERVKTVGADVISLDWRAQMDRSRALLGADQTVQGNLDPCVLLGDPDTIRRRTIEILKQAGPKGHIMNLGHGILPMTPRENARTFIETVQEFRHEGAS